MVAEVQPESTAEAAGFLPGDIMVSLDGSLVDSTGALQSSLAAHSTGLLSVSLQRGGDAHTVVIRWPETASQDQGERDAA